MNRLPPTLYGFGLLAQAESDDETMITGEFDEDIAIVEI